VNEPLDIAMAELRWIPRGSLAQNIFRDTYFCLRENSLGRQPELENDPRVVRDAAIALVSATWPGFHPEHNAALLAARGS
jgi:hypothetical protein